MLGLLLSSTFAIDGTKFLLNGTEFVVNAAEITPSRHHHSEWEDRIKKAKWAGFNTITVNVVWRAYERENGGLDFTEAQHDLVHFVDLCQQHGLYVIVRPGPFLHVQANLGGWPHRLFSKVKRFRTSDDVSYSKAYAEYITALTDCLSKYSVNAGGPIIIYQVEDLYFSWLEYDAKYLDNIQEIIKSSGFDGVYMTADTPSQLLKPTDLANAAVGLDMQEYEAQFFADAEALNPNTPVLASRLNIAQDTVWGSEPKLPNCEALQKTLLQFVENRRSFILSPLAEGTNFDSLAGSTTESGWFRPFTTRQGFYAPITESGALGHCFNEIKAVLASVKPKTAENLLEVQQVQGIEKFELIKIGGLADQIDMELPPNYAWQHLQDLPIEAAFAIYSIDLPKGEPTLLSFEQIQDYAQIFVGDTLLGLYDRQKQDLTRPKPIQFIIPSLKEPTQLQILVYALGHEEFYSQNPEDYKGLIGSMLGGKPITTWRLRYKRQSAILAKVNVADNTQFSGGVFEGRFKARKDLGTYFDFRNFKRGFIAVNYQHILGSYQESGPQYRLYCPGAWLQDGENTLLIIDVENSAGGTVAGFELPEGCPEGQKLYEGFCQ